jgi:hypothetical protein
MGFPETILITITVVPYYRFAGNTISETNEH